MKRLCALLLLFGSTFASDFTELCLPRDVGYLELEATLLFWKVSSPGFFLGTLNGKDLVLETKFQVGSRLAARYFSRDECRNIGLSWTHFDRLTEERSFTAPSGVIVSPIGVDATRVYEANLKFEYNNLELLVSQQVLCIGRLNLNLFAGLTGSRMLQRHQANYEEANGGVSCLRTRVVFEGIGPEAGANLEYHLCGCAWDFVAQASAAYLLGERRREDNRFQFESTTEWIPAFYARGGIRWTARRIPFKLMLELGYELRHYADAFLRNTHPVGSDDSFAKDFTVGGPYFAVRVRF